MTYDISTAKSKGYLIVRVMEPMTAELAGRTGADATRRGREENITAFLGDDIDYFLKWRYRCHVFSPPDRAEGRLIVILHCEVRFSGNRYPGRSPAGVWVGSPGVSRYVIIRRERGIYQIV